MATQTVEAVHILLIQPYIASISASLRRLRLLSTRTSSQPQGTGIDRLTLEMTLSTSQAARPISFGLDLMGRILIPARRRPKFVRSHPMLARLVCMDAEFRPG